VRGLALRETSSYVFDFLTASGSAADDSTSARARGARVELVLPDGAVLAARDYLVVVVTAVRDGRRSPRPMEVHMTWSTEGARIVGIRH
jgi:hypothetical protein